MRILRILNPFIWCWNVLNYNGHLEQHRNSKEFVRYDFSKDVKYFK